MGKFAALQLVVLVYAEVLPTFPNSKWLHHWPTDVTQRDDQVPGEGGIVQPVVDAREVGGLATVDVERRDRLQACVLGCSPRR
jgi:hypothetical protein